MRDTQPRTMSFYILVDLLGMPVYFTKKDDSQLGLIATSSKLRVSGSLETLVLYL